MMALSISPSGKVSPAFKYTCDPPILLAHADACTGSSRRAAPDLTRSIASRTVIILVIDAGGHFLCCSFSASTAPLSASTTTYATTLLSAGCTAAGARPRACADASNASASPNTINPVDRLIARPPLTAPPATCDGMARSARQRPSYLRNGYRLERQNAQASAAAPAGCSARAASPASPAREGWSR